MRNAVAVPASAAVLERDDLSSNRHPALHYWWSMIFSENRHPPSPSRGRAFRDHALTACHHHRLAFEREAHGQAAGLGQHPGIEGLNRVGIDRSTFRTAFQQAGQGLRDTRIEAG